MSGPLSEKPDVTTTHAPVTNAYLPAGVRPNKTPIFISGFRDTCAFLAWLRTSCPCVLTAQLKAEKLMVVPSNANSFRAVVSTLRSFDYGEGVSFYTFALPEERCVRFRVMNLGRGMPERRPAGAGGPGHSCPGSHAAAFRPSRLGPNKGPPSHLHFIVSVARGPEVSKVRSITEVYGLRVSVESYEAPKCPLQCKRCQRFGHT